MPAGRGTLSKLVSGEEEEESFTLSLLARDAIAAVGYEFASANNVASLQHCPSRIETRSGDPRVEEEKEVKGIEGRRAVAAGSYSRTARKKQLMGAVYVRRTCKREGYLRAQKRSRHMAHYELM